MNSMTPLRRYKRKCWNWNEGESSLLGVVVEEIMLTMNDSRRKRRLEYIRMLRDYNLLKDIGQEVVGKLGKY